MSMCGRLTAVAAGIRHCPGTFRLDAGAVQLMRAAGAHNRRRPILPSLVLRAFFVVQSKRRAQRFLHSRKRLIVPRRTACVVLAMTMRPWVAI